jgi:hypothetical protein
MLMLNKDEETALLLAIQNDFLTALTVAEASVDVTVFDEFPVQDDVTFEDWVLRNESWNNPLILAVASQLTTAIVGREPGEVGSHYWFDYLQSGGGWQALLDDGEDGAQRHMIKTGRHCRAARGWMCADLGTQARHQSLPPWPTQCRKGLF